MTARLYATAADAGLAAREQLPDASPALQASVAARAWRGQVSVNEALIACARDGMDPEGYELDGVCSVAGCLRDARAEGLCATHYQQRRRTGSTKPVRRPAAGRIGVRLSAEALAALGARPAERAREVIEAWAAGR